MIKEVSRNYGRMLYDEKFLIIFYFSYFCLSLLLLKEHQKYQYVKHRMFQVIFVNRNWYLQLLY